MKKKYMLETNKHLTRAGYVEIGGMSPIIDLKMR